MAGQEVNTIAKSNGNESEKIAMSILQDKFDNPEYLNNLIDFYSSNGIPIEVKSCQEFILRNDKEPRPNLYRHGRFVLDREQHLFLIAKQGYYLFLVKAGSLLIHAKLIQAEDLTFGKNAFNFRRNISWHEVF